MKAHGYSEKDEKRILDVLGRGLLNEFPNPERNGCPGPDVLKRIASHEMPLSEAEKWLDHLTSCSPCYRDFSQLRVAQRQRRTRTLLAIAAGILIIACLAGWAWFASQRQPFMTPTAVLDLRNRSVARGGEPNPAEPPLQASLKATRRIIYLPLGSSEGTYDMRDLGSNREPMVHTSGTAKLAHGVPALDIPVSLSSRPPGQYVLEMVWNGVREGSYSVELR